MDLIELARSIQADRERDIAAAMRRRRWLAQTPPSPPEADLVGHATGRSARVAQSVPSTRPSR